MVQHFVSLYAIGGRHNGARLVAPQAVAHQFPPLGIERHSMKMQAAVVLSKCLLFLFFLRKPCFQIILGRNAIRFTNRKSRVKAAIAIDGIEHHPGAHTADGEKSG